MDEPKNLILLNALDVTSFYTSPLPDGSTAKSRSHSFAAGLPGATEIRYLVRPGAEIPGNLCVAVEADTPSGLLDAFPTEGFNDIFYVYADCPLLSSEISASMYERHRRYLSHYSFADGYPYGLTPEIVSCEIVPKLRSLAESMKGRIDRETLFAVIQTDINAFDIETELSPTDQRQLRVSLTTDNLRNFKILERVVAAGGRDAASVASILDQRPLLLRSVPAYISLQIVDGCPQACSYCPYPGMGGDILHQRNEMDLERVEEIVSKVARFCGDAVFNLSVWGEPSLHSQIDRLVEAISGGSKFPVIIETSGIGWKREQIDSIIDGCDGVTWIVSLDAIEEELYQKLRGPGFHEAVSTAEYLLERASAHTYIQAVRMQESEESLEAFYRHWKSRTDHVIIQKYSRFAGALPHRQVADLSPINRIPCWHIKRDLVVLLDGSVPSCREDIHQTNVLGNVFENSLEEIWARGSEWYEKHISGDYPDLCRECDEYYTFNH